MSNMCVLIMVGLVKWEKLWISVRAEASLDCTNPSVPNPFGQLVIFD